MYLVECDAITVYGPNLLSVGWTSWTLVSRGNTFFLYILKLQAKNLNYSISAFLYLHIWTSSWKKEKIDKTISLWFMPIFYFHQKKLKYNIIFKLSIILIIYLLCIYHFKIQLQSIATKPLSQQQILSKRNKIRWVNMLIIKY